MTTGRINQVSNAVPAPSGPPQRGINTGDRVHIASPEGERVVETDEP